MSDWDPPPPRFGLEPADPDMLQPDRPTLGLSTEPAGDQSFSAANWIGASLPFAAAALALLSGLSVEIAPNGSWDGGDLLLSILAVAGITCVFGVPLLFMLRGWQRQRTGGQKLLLFLGIAAAYLGAAFASFWLAVAIAFVREPPEC